MDFNSLKDQVSNLTLYDIKAGVRKVQNGKLPHSRAGEGPGALILLL
jgi:epsin